jgi:hypothetical protein
MVAEKFVALQVGVVKGVFTEEYAGVATGHHESAQSHYQGILKPLVGNTFKSLHDTSITAVPRETEHHHCGDFWVEIISCGNRTVTEPSET